MDRRAPSIVTYIGILALFVFLVPQGVSHPAAAQAESQLFPETGKTVSGRFLQYWQQHGGLAQQGYPISDLLSEKSDVDGKTYTVQYFERAVFEMHTENQQPYDVLLSLLGSERYAEKYGPGGAPNQHTSTDNPLYFSETKHTVGGVFRTYWEAHGGLADQGYPISDEFEEQAADGKTYTVQYFERAVFERHPENAGTPYEVLLSQLGSNRYTLLYKEVSFPPPVSPELVQSDGRFSDHYFVWTEFQVQPCFDCWGPPPFLYVPVVTRALDVRTWQTITVSTVPTKELYLALYGSTAVGVDSGHCPHCQPGQRVISKNLTTGMTDTLSIVPDSTNLIAFPYMSYGRYFGWVESNESGGKLFLWDSATGETQVVFPPAEAPNISFTSVEGINENYIVYLLRTKESELTLRVYDRRTGIVRQIASGDPNYIMISGDMLLWNDLLLRNDGPVHLTNLATGESRVVYGQVAFPELLQGSFAVWNTYDPQPNGATNTYGLDLRKGKTVKLPMLQGPVAAGDWIMDRVGDRTHTRFTVTSLLREFHNATALPATSPTPTAGAAP